MECIIALFALLIVCFGDLFKAAFPMDDSQKNKRFDEGE